MFLSSKASDGVSKSFPTSYFCHLTEKEDCFSMGYKDFGYIHNLFGDVLLFYDGNYSNYSVHLYCKFPING